MEKKIATRASIEKTASFVADNHTVVCPELRSVLATDPYLAHVHERFMGLGGDGLIVGLKELQPDLYGRLSAHRGLFAFGTTEGNAARRKVHYGLDLGDRVLCVHPFGKLLDPHYKGGRPILADEFDCLPAPLRKVYFHEFCGLSLFTMTDTRYDHLPVLISSRDFWFPIDDTLSAVGQKANGLPKLLERMPDLRPDERGDIWRKFWTILSSVWPLKRGRDFFSLHVRAKDRPSDVFLMRNGDVETLEPVGATLMDRLDAYLVQRIDEPDAEIAF